MSLIGNVYGSWTIIEESEQRTMGRLMIIARCECGIVKSMGRSQFIHGGHSSKCFKCHLKMQKSRPITSQRKN